VDTAVGEAIIFAFCLLSKISSGHSLGEIMTIAKTAVEQFFGEFILKSKGQLVSSLVSGSNLPPNADYYFPDSAIIGELKCLQIDSFGPNYQVNLQKLVDGWMERRLLLVYGRTQIDIRNVPPTCQKEWMNLVETPLQKNVLASANRQIKETKKLLASPNSKGILFLSSDGNRSLQPYDVMFFLDRILKKKKEDSSLQYSNIDGMVYFSWTMPGRLPNIPRPIQFWMGFPRDPNDTKVKEFMDHLENLWYEFQCDVMGHRIPRMIEKSNLLQDIKIS
jgi:hypothetical protein